MKKVTFPLFIIWLSITIHARDNELQIGLQGGYYKAADYKKIKPGKNISMDLSYFFNDKVFISSQVGYGKSWYLEDEKQHVLNTFNYGNGTNAEIFNIIASLTIGYQQRIIKNLTISGQVGVGSYTEVKTFSYQYDDYISPYETIYTDLAFPFKIGLGLTLMKHLNIGITGGTHIIPGYPFAGSFVGPRVSFVY